MICIWPRSARFDEAVRDSHTVSIDVSLWSPGSRELIADSLDVDGGDLTASQSAQYRRSCQVSLVDRDGSLGRVFRPGRAVPPVELHISRGITYTDGTRELIPMGILVVASARAKIWPSTVYNINAFDRSRRVSRNTFTSPYVIQPGTAYTTAAADLVRSRLPFPIDVAITSSQADTTAHPLVFFEQDDPLASAKKLAGAAGCEIFFDQVGRLIIRDEHSVRGGPDFVYTDGATSIILPDSEIEFSDDPGYNGVLVTGENSGNSTSVSRFLAYDDRPESDTYFFGDYGQVTEYVNDPEASDAARAELIARSRLRRHLGRGNAVTLATVPHPAHDPSDILGVRFHGVEQLMQLESIQIPLDTENASSISAHSQLAPAV